MKQPQFATLTLDTIVGGGQALGTLPDGRKAFVWGGLPDEKVAIRITKKKTKFVEGVVTEVHTASPQRIAPLDPDSYLSTSPWQIMNFEAEQHYKAALIEEAFELHDIVLPEVIDVYTDGNTTRYRNKVEFSWYGMRESKEARDKRHDKTGHHQNLAQAGDDERGSAQNSLSETEILGADSSAGPAPSDLRAAKGSDDGSGESHEKLDLAFFRRGSKGKIIVDQCALLPNSIMKLAEQIRSLLEERQVSARDLKTLLIRCDQHGKCAWQLYVKTESFDTISEQDAATFAAQGGEIIYSDPRSPASRITKRLHSFGNTVLTDTVLGVPFSYATEGFFQVNIPVYEQALRDMREWVDSETLVSEKHLQPVIFNDAYSKKIPREAVSETEEASGKNYPIIDLYSGVGSIGLTIGGDNCTLVEIDENAVREMKRNIEQQGSSATAVLAPSEKALEYITSDQIVIVDPPRAGLHQAVIDRLLETTPPRIIYLSCNPVTQARDVALLSSTYGIRSHRGYNFFPRTPHIEHLVVLDRIQQA